MYSFFNSRPSCPRERFVMFFTLVLGAVLFASCSMQKQIDSSARTTLFGSAELVSAHIGISIYEPATGRYWYNYQADKYFTPASNTKIFSCYAGMKYLGDSLPGLAYKEDNNSLFIAPTADPTLLHPDYQNQPVITFLQHTGKKIYLVNNQWQEEPWGAGWSWDDYNADYMAERSALPVYGNTIRFIQTQTENSLFNLHTLQAAVYTQPEIDWKLNFDTDTAAARFSVKRSFRENVFRVTQGKEKFRSLDIPFLTNGTSSALALLKDTVWKTITIANQFPVTGAVRIIHSQPADSMFRPMMHRSDNFFAEQTLLMVSSRLLGVMNDDKIIDTLLKTDFKGLPQRPSWADGSGLSRFNLFTPQDFVWVLNKMKADFPWKRISSIFATGNTGTLTNYYVADSSFIYAKTGSLSGVIALSGYLVTKKNRTLIFSVLVNNHTTAARNVRRAVEKFIGALRDNY